MVNQPTPGDASGGPADKPANSAESAEQVSREESEPPREDQPALDQPALDIDPSSRADEGRFEPLAPPSPWRPSEPDSVISPPVAVLSPRRLTLFDYGLLIAVFGLFDLFMPGVLNNGNEFAAGLVMGGFVGQYVLLSVWAVVGPPPLVGRWLGCLGVAMVWMGCAAAGVVAAESPSMSFDDAKSLLGIVFQVPVVFFITQSPVWLPAIFGWRLRAAMDGPRERNRFQLVHLFGAMAMVAVSLGLSRIGVAMERENWIMILSYGFSGAGVTAVLGIPATWIVFRIRDTLLVLALLGGLTVGANLVLAAVVVGINAGAAPPADFFVAVLAFAASLVAALCIPLGVARGLGYRLA